MEAPEHPRPALSRNLDGLFAQNAPDELGDARVLGVEPVRSYVEVEVAVVERPPEATDDPVAFDDGDRVAAAGELVADGEAGYAGAHDGD